MRSCGLSLHTIAHLADIPAPPFCYFLGTVAQDVKQATVEMAQAAQEKVVEAGQAAKEAVGIAPEEGVGEGAARKAGEAVGLAAGKVVLQTESCCNIASCFLIFSLPGSSSS